MGFGDLKTEAAQAGLNDYLADKSYIEGYVPSQGDVVVFQALTCSPPSKLNHALRWYNQIASYSTDEKLAFPGVQKPIDQYGPCGSGDGKGQSATADDDDDDFDLFGSDEENDAEAERVKQERMEQYAAKKEKKPATVAKSSIVLDVKPWDDETDLNKMEELVRSVSKDGLLWGASKFLPVAYGIKKLQISCVVEDEKIGTDFLEDSITAFEDIVQSVDIVAFNKI